MIDYAPFPVRRLLVLTVAIGLAAPAGASAALGPVRRDTREDAQPRVRAGTLHVPAGHRAGLTRVVVTLGPPPLAAWHATRTLAAARAASRLDVHTAASRAYLTHLAALQRTVAGRIRAAIPRASVQEHYRVLLDGFALRLPYTALPRLVRIAAVHHVYPSLSYYATDDGGPSTIQATTLASATGDLGQGMKIAIVDTGVDRTNPYLSPKGFSYPPGFPRGDVAMTTPKVIVARDFPGPIRNRLSNQAFDPTEPHGTHVAGIAAGDAGTTAPAGPDHPRVAGLSGVAPRAWIGNYRVFNEPTPEGDEADTPEIVEAFEAAVDDGMNVINFSGGGPQTDPANDALVQAVRNVALAGVVPVIAAGNDRDTFGLGTTGSPGTAPDAITVAATSSPDVFAPALSVAGAPPTLAEVPIQMTEKTPAAWSAGATIVDASSLLGSDGKPVAADLCGPPGNPNGALGTIRKGSLTGRIVLASRGTCSFASKGERAAYAGAAGLILVDNRPGEANQIPLALAVPSGMISDLDGARLRAFLAANGGAASVRVSSGVEEIPTNRAGVITSFSSAGPTDFGGALKPDIAAPGLDVLSSTPPQTTGSTFTVFAGTSMATPHVAGAAALLLQRHPGWTPWNVKSALMSTAGPAWGDTARTTEASVLLEGAGLADVAAADDPQVFTDPQSLSLGRIDVTHGAQVASQLLTVTDAGGGAGDWSVLLQAQTQPAGVRIDVTPRVTVEPGGDTTLPFTVHVAADAALGESTGFVLLERGGVTRRVPYAFLVERPALAHAPVRKLRPLQQGTTETGANRVTAYCCPSAPFGPPPDYTGAPMNEDGAETVFRYDVTEPVVNFGVSVPVATPGALVDPFVLGSLDENDVQGYTGTPTDVNALTFDFGVDIGAAGVQFPRLQRFYVAVDSRADPFTGAPEKGGYVLHAWANDVTPPSVRLLTTRVSAGRPLVAVRTLDAGAGVDPLSLVFNYEDVLVGASAYDPATGIALFGLPADAPPLRTGTTPAELLASDFQEAKNVNSVGGDLMPNSTFESEKITVVDGPAVSWLEPGAHACATRSDRLAVAGGSTRRVTKVVFRDGARTIATVEKGASGLYTATWKTAGLARGAHRLTATLTDATGRTATATETVRVCT